MFHKGILFFIVLFSISVRAYSQQLKTNCLDKISKSKAVLQVVAKQIITRLDNHDVDSIVCYLSSGLRDRSWGVILWAKNSRYFSQKIDYGKHHLIIHSKKELTPVLIQDFRSTPNWILAQQKNEGQIICPDCQETWLFCHFDESTNCVVGIIDTEFSSLRGKF